jgi:predicted alpha/beta-hydrolase family hydrolase
MISKLVSIDVSESIGKVSGELMVPDKMKALYVFAHGAGAGMKHPFMVKLSAALESLSIGTLRYNFPYMENGKKRPDVPAVAEKTVSRAIATARELFPDAMVIAGGKSFGGRMTSQHFSKVDPDFVKGLVFVGFPLHAPGNPGVDRANHLATIKIPLLFLQGTRDALASIELIEKVASSHRKATLKKFEGADHSFKAGKQDLIEPLAQSIASWAGEL